MTDTQHVPASAEPQAFGAYRPTGWTAKLIGHTRAMPNHWLGQRLAYVLRKLALMRMHGQPLDVEALGARMRLFPYNNVCEKRLVFTPQYFDPEERAFLEERIRDGFVFVDVGANVGGYTLFVAARAGQTGRVLAIEPQPAIFERLVFNIRQNPFATVKALDCAVADKSGDVTLFIDSRNNGQSSVKFVGLSRGPSVRVPARPLAELMEQEGFTRVDAIKLDVHGAEDLILEPFLRTASDDLLPRLFLIENAARRWQVDVVALLKARGYEMVRRTRHNMIFERRAGRA
ncbi:FkbM family methyltransferase [Alsobacter sp. SYSU M60028]|uniref:FkbM family methyltransferase n=1 Tax=Alsobacter ponti TaxID=2962936 RepID=A0ABT1LH95_9HYPH|nr:FkbM family methyltransferase [Alsobacter ponti]MCP8940466.1 FkbM family methyltransferase [Alsobacter ponti]